MDRLISLLDKEARRVICAIGRNGAFYSSALKTLKREFGNTYVVSQLKFSKIMQLPSISPSDNKGLRYFHQQLKEGSTYLNSMRYVSSLKSTDKATKAVLRLPKYLRMPFYKNFTAENFCGENIYLKVG